MIKVATFTNNDEFCPQELRALAFIVLPNGKLWDVRFSGATEEEARQKAIALWNAEKAKQPLDIVIKDPWTGKVLEQHHLANTIWVIHKETREKKRIPLTEISMYEKQGWERGGPRSR